MADKKPAPIDPNSEGWLDPDEVLIQAGEKPVPKPRTKVPKYNTGGMVKAGSPKVTAPCADTKTLKCY
jgi:hypothetical protein